jgi:hypothetical protein
LEERSIDERFVCWLFFITWVVTLVLLAGRVITTPQPLIASIGIEFIWNDVPALHLRAAFNLLHSHQIYLSKNLIK